MQRLILYHANCNDGTWAAWAALQAILPRSGEVIDCLGVYYNKPLPDRAWQVAEAGGQVLIVDFSYPASELMKLQEAGASVMVIDHHETAMNQLSGFENAVFAMDRSGAVLTWETFSKGRLSEHSLIQGQPVPPILKYVQDRDLWRHELPWTREVYAAMSNYGWMGVPPNQLSIQIQKDTGLSAKGTQLIDHLKEEGRPLFSKRMDEVRAMATRQKYWVDLGQGLVPIVEAQRYWSDVANMLCHVWLDAPYAVCYRCDRNGDAVLDLRSLGYPVNEVAKSLGGGGHRKAAGCPIPDSTLLMARDRTPLGMLSADGIAQEFDE